MKKVISSIIMTVFCISLFPQAPHSFRYQTVVRNNAGELLPDKLIGLKISILKDSPTGDLVFSEIHSLRTNAQGLINLSVGAGNPVSGSIDDIEWSDGTYFLRIDADIDGGTDFEFLGSSQLLSVPYALYAEKSGVGGGVISDLYWKRNGNDLYYKDGNIGIGTNNPDRKLHVESFVEEGQIRDLVYLRNLSPSNTAYTGLNLRADDYNYGLGISFTSSNYNLINDFHQVASIMTNGRALALSTSSPQGSVRFFTNKDESGIIERMRITSDGNVGIGTKTPQHRLSIEGTEEEWPGRILLSIRNNSLGPKSLSYLKIYAGLDETGTALGHISATYTANERPEDVAGFGILSSSGNGMIIGATKPDMSPGIIKFFNGQTSGTAFIETMRISETGNVGIGTGNPRSKIQIAEGDIYISDINRGIIMVSPNGQCWRGILNNSGILEFAPVSCP